MCTYCTTKNYRKVYQVHNGPIPIDKNGRRYHIHHIDGDRSNNHYTNLKAAATGVINSKEIKAAKEQQVKKDNQVDDLNQLKTLVKNQLANTKDTLGKKERATKANPEGVKLMKEGKDTLKEKIKERYDDYKKSSNIDWDKEKVKLMREMFQELCLFLERLGWLEESGFEQ